MKYLIKKFKSLEICLKELEPYIRDGNHLQTGKPFKNFDNLRSREILCNWLLCVVLNYENDFEKALLTTNRSDVSGDGMIYDGENYHTTEHIVISNHGKSVDYIEPLILNAIKKKQNKGKAAYASGKILVVLINVSSPNPWHPDQISKKLTQPLYFNQIFLLGLENIVNDLYTYNVTLLGSTECHSWKVHIDSNFKRWEVKRVY